MLVGARIKSFWGIWGRGKKLLTSSDDVVGRSVGRSVGVGNYLLQYGTSVYYVEMCIKCTVWYSFVVEP
jgi:hypothetical protein